MWSTRGLPTGLACTNSVERMRAAMRLGGTPLRFDPGRSMPMVHDMDSYTSLMFVPGNRVSVAVSREQR